MCLLKMEERQLPKCCIYQAQLGWQTVPKNEHNVWTRQRRIESFLLFWWRVFYKVDSNSVQTLMTRFFMNDKLQITLSGSKGPLSSRGTFLESAWRNWDKPTKILCVISDAPIDIRTNHVASGICRLSTCQAMILVLFLIWGIFLHSYLGFTSGFKFTGTRVLFTITALESMTVSDVVRPAS